jgi:hypothetical protein
MRRQASGEREAHLLLLDEPQRHVVHHLHLREGGESRWLLGGRRGSGGRRACESLSMISNVSVGALPIFFVSFTWPGSALGTWQCAGAAASAARLGRRGRRFERALQVLELGEEGDAIILGTALDPVLEEVRALRQVDPHLHAFAPL